MGHFREKADSAATAQRGQLSVCGRFIRIRNSILARPAWLIFGGSTEMITRIVSFFLIVGSAVLATTKVERPISEMVAHSDYIVVGKITRVAMFDGRNREVSDPHAETGPGRENEIRFYVSVDVDGFLKVREPLPQKIVIARWKMWHMDLASMKEEAEGNSYIFFLESDPSRPILTLDERFFLESRSEIEELIQDQKSESNQPPQPTTDSSSVSRG